MSKKKKKNHNYQTAKKEPPPQKTSKTDIILYSILAAAVLTLIILISCALARSSSNKKEQPVFLPEPMQTELNNTPNSMSEESESDNRNNSDPIDLPTETNLPETPISPDEDGIVCLDVENIMQIPGFPNGCEVVSLTIALKYLGYDIDQYTLYYDHMPKSPLRGGDPWTTYVGEATDIGFGCYAPCVVTTGNDYLRSVGGNHIVKDVSYQKLEEYEKYIDEGKPVIMWGMLDMVWNPSLVWVAYINGEEVIWHSHSHCLVMIGYTEDEYIFCDPLQGVVRYGKYEVLDCFTAMFKQACIIEEYDRPEDEEPYVPKWDTEEEVYVETEETDFEDIPAEI